MDCLHYLFTYYSGLSNQNVDRPTKQVVCSAKQVFSPTEQVACSEKQFTCPVKQVASLTKQVAFPVKQLTSPPTNWPVSSNALRRSERSESCRCYVLRMWIHFVV